MRSVSSRASWRCRSSVVGPARTARRRRASSPHRESRRNRPRCPSQLLAGRRLDPVVAATDHRAHARSSASANATSPWIERRPHAGDAHGAAAERAGSEEIRRGRRIAFDVECVPGARVARAARECETHASRPARRLTPKRAIRFVVMATYGFEMRSPAMSTRDTAPGACGQHRQRHQQRGQRTGSRRRRAR